MKKENFLIFLSVFVLISSFFIALDLTRNQKTRSNVVVSKGGLSGCDFAQPKDMRIKFCLDKSLLDNYKSEYFDMRKASVNQSNKITFKAETVDYSQTLPPPGAYWKATRINSGITVVLTANFDSQFKTFKQMADYYVVGYTEPHNEFRPKKGTIGKINNLDYVADIFPYKEGSWIDVETHFFNKGVQYDLTIAASLKTINETTFRELHNNLLSSVEFLQ